jgi:hypothetical protein
MTAVTKACLTLFCLFTACVGPQMPEGEGRGLLSFDRQPPPDAATFAAPRWQAGDRFVFVRGSAQRLTMHVEAESDGFALVDDTTKSSQLLSHELADLGLREPDARGKMQAVIALAPGDARYHWPLWVGKRWSCQFYRKAPGQPPLPLLVTYAVEASEEVTVPAGTFQTLRILRRTSVAAQGTFLERASLCWYAPRIGAEVRRLDDGVLTELAEVHRQ